MKINIQIEDANLEELQRLFAGVPERLEYKITLPDPQAVVDRGGQFIPLPTTTEAKIDPTVQSTPTPIITVTKVPKKPAPKKTPHSKHGDLQLPCRFSDDRKRYQAAWSICRAFNFVPYPDALKLQEAKKAERAAKPKKPCSPAHQRVRDAVKNAPPAAEIHKKINDTIIKQNGAIHAGQFVKHNGSHSSPFFGQIGEVIKVNDKGEIFVKFGSSTTWIPQYIVMVMPEAPVS